MGKYSDLAVEHFKSGCNCSQSVFLAFSKEFGFDEDTALKISSSFGGGMGRLREVCGAVSSMFAIAGLKYGYTEKGNDEVKKKHYKFIQHLASEFKKEHNSIICRDLLGLQEGEHDPTPTPRTEEFYKTRPCARYIATAAKIIENECGFN